MKRILKKILVLVLILLLLNNFLINSYASTGVDSFGDFIGGLFSGVVGVLTYLYRAPAVAIGWLIDRFMVTLAYAEGSIDPTAGGIFDSLTIFDVLFTKPKLLDINFFDIVDGDTSLVNQFRINVAAWFYIMRNISAGILLVILIYIGIRMATSTVASDRAMYKRMLADWTVSLLLIFVLSYIIIFTIEINNALVKAMEATQSSTDGLSETMKTFGKEGIRFLGGIPSIVAAIIYIMLLWQTLALFFAYFNRMLKVAFLIIIAPLISLTYSIDKIGDGKAQALDAWLKEFVFTILMQPFHCAIYMSLISTSLRILVARGGWNEVSQTLGAGIMAIVCILFTREAEKIVRKIFGFKDDNKSTSLVAGAMLASTALNKAKSAGSGTIKAVQGTKNFLANGKDALRWTNIKAEAKSAWGYIRGRDLEGKKTDKDYATLRSEARTKEFDEAASRLEGALGTAKRNQDISEEKIKRAEEIKQEIEEIKSNNPGISDAEAKAIARFNVNKRTVTNRGAAGHPILTAKGKIRKVTSLPGKGYKVARKGIHSLSEALPMAETRALLAKEVKKAPSFLVGAGMLGTTGKVSSAVAGYKATNQFIEGATKNSKGSIVNDLEKFTKAHSADDKAGILKKVKNNPQDYALDKDSDEVPEHLKEIIDELRAFGIDIGTSDIKNTIVNNPKNAGKKLNDLLLSKSPEGLDVGEIGKKLLDYGQEYSINQSLETASEAGIPMGDLIKSMGLSSSEGMQSADEVGEYVQLSGDTEMQDIQSKIQKIQNMKIADKFVSSKKDGDRDDTEVSTYVENIISSSSGQGKSDDSEVASRLAELDKELESVLASRRNAKKTSEEYDKRTQELERKKALLIGKAVAEIKNENEAAVEALRTKILGELGILLSKPYDESDKDELRKLKEKLENLGKENS